MRRKGRTDPWIYVFGFILFLAIFNFFPFKTNVQMPQTDDLVAPQEIVGLDQCKNELQVCQDRLTSFECELPASSGYGVQWFLIPVLVVLMVVLVLLFYLNKAKKSSQTKLLEDVMDVNKLKAANERLMADNMELKKMLVKAGKPKTKTVKKGGRYEPKKRNK